jgi:hypothetical protein
MSRKMRTEEWLPQAKRLAVGMTKRVYHGAESRPNLVVKNMDAYYSGYCHACHEGGRVDKEFVIIRPVTPTNRLAGDPGHLRRIDFAVPDMNIPYQKLATFLHSKNMAVDYLPNPMWSAQDQRIVFVGVDQVVGRDVTGLSPSKWYRYSQTANYMRVQPTALADQIVILTEDFFSAAKGNYFAPAGVCCVSLMGTVMFPDLFSELLRAKKVIILLDGDDAGRAGASQILRSLRLVGVTVVNSTLPEGKDPKDMSPTWWEQFMELI